MPDMPEKVLNQEPADGLTIISQVGFVVRDLEKTVEKMRKTLGVEPVAIMQMPEKERKYHGEDGDFSARIGFYRFANIELEFIEPGGGPSVWMDHINEKGEGLHHVRFNIKSIDELAGLFSKKGIAISQQGASTREGHHWAYFDTEEALGFVVEVFDELKDIP